MGLIKIMKKICRPSANHKGRVGEHNVKKVLSPMFFGKVKHKLINDLMIVDENNKSHQIDHVEIRNNGIFCIETKNYEGYIFGKENEQYWTQSFRSCTYKILNPIKQNKSHIYHLNKLLGNKYFINSVIVMCNDNADNININYVVNINDLRDYLNNFNNGINYTDQEMNDIYDEIISLNADISRRKHIKNIEETQSNIDNNICPRCKGSLVKRNGKYGEFIGCSNYPNCKFILR